MRPGREVDTLIAKHIFSHDVIIKRKMPTEVTPSGERPLREYSREIGAAFDVAIKMNISLIPIEGGSWFALAGENEGFSSPATFIQYLSVGDFANAGAAVTESAPLSICLAALKAIETKLSKDQQESGSLEQ
ncbi:MAG TPA: hypothetical protein VNJ01_07550 [Bacteriovoracaceae bacterium]|nr:hypothetical protein [Bacteriovoracaceae bacterium]